VLHPSLHAGLGDAAQAAHQPYCKAWPGCMTAAQRVSQTGRLAQRGKQAADVRCMARGYTWQVCCHSEAY